jgi:hypothetical protein
LFLLYIVGCVCRSSDHLVEALSLFKPLSFTATAEVNFELKLRSFFVFRYRPPVTFELFHDQKAALVLEYQQISFKPLIPQESSMLAFESLWKSLYFIIKGVSFITRFPPFHEIHKKSSSVSDLTYINYLLCATRVQKDLKFIHDRLLFLSKHASWIYNTQPTVCPDSPVDNSLDIHSFFNLQMSIIDITKYKTLYSIAHLRDYSTVNDGLIFAKLYGKVSSVSMHMIGIFMDKTSLDISKISQILEYSDAFLPETEIKLYLRQNLVNKMNTMALKKIQNCIDLNPSVVSRRGVSELITELKRGNRILNGGILEEAIALLCKND